MNEKRFQGVELVGKNEALTGFAKSIKMDSLLLLQDRDPAPCNPDENWPSLLLQRLQNLGWTQSLGCHLHQSVTLWIFLRVYAAEE